MENSFDALRKSLIDQIGQLEAQCNDVIRAMRLETVQLRKELVEVADTRLPQHEDPASKAAPFTPKSVSQSWSVTPTPTPAMCTTPGRSICWTPGRPKSHNLNSHSLQVLQQPTLHLPLEWIPLEHEIVDKSPDVSFLAELTAQKLKREGVFREDMDKVTCHWERLASRIILPKKSRAWFKNTEEHLCLWPFWTVITQRGSQQQQSVARRSKSFLSRGESDANSSSLRVGTVVTSGNSCARHLAVHPDHFLSIANGLVQGLLILFDVINFPLATFYSADSPIDVVMLHVSVAYWSWSMIFSFMMGYQSSEGMIEMRPVEISRHYIRHWFLFDLVILALDWSSLIMYVLEDPGTRNSSLARATKVTKVQKILRGCRILRAGKASRKILHLLDTGASANWMFMMIRILILLVIILLVNHYIACAWYAIGDSSTRQNTWVKAQMIEDKDVFDKYVYSLHWSLTQFTPCTNDIAPANGIERFFASLVVLFALVVFSAFLSSLTSAIVNFRKLNAHWYHEQVQIHEFLQRKKIPVKVASRVWHYYRTHYRYDIKIVPEKDIHFFNVLPRSLCRELHNAAYLPILQKHPMIKVLIRADDSCMGDLLSDIVSTVAPVSGQDVFLEGEVATHMYFILSGRSVYHYKHSASMLMAPDILAEAVLWLQDWRHPGNLTVFDGGCELMLLNAKGFMSCIDAEASPVLLRALRKYASLFAQHHADMQTERRSVIGRSGTASTEFNYDGHLCTRCPDFQLDKDTNIQMLVRSFPYGVSDSKLASAASFFSAPEKQPNSCCTMKWW